MSVQTTLKQTPLYSSHVALNARMVEFGGWDMPVQYEGILAEYEATRNAAAVFDISHMGEFIVEGDFKESGLDKIVTQRLSDLPVQSCRYGAILNHEGGVIDDLIIFRMEEKKWFLVVNGATTEKDAEHIKKNLTKEAKFIDVSQKTGKIDLQGPLAREILSSFVADINKLNYYTFDFFDLLGENVLISRTGYTGELGYEIYYPWDKTIKVWDALLKDERIKPAGLGARDLLRLEMGYSLYGHELTEGVSPLESGLERFIDFEKDFIGKDALMKEKAGGVKRRVAGFVSESRKSPRADQKIYSEDLKEVGVVTSGGFSPALEKGIGLGFVDSEYLKNSKRILFGDSKKKTSAVIGKKVFYTNGSLKN